MNQDTYNPLVCTTTLIQFPNKQEQHATGFFYNYNDSTYLVTNRHVLEHKYDQPEEISIRYRNYSDIACTNREEIPLYSEGFPRWLIHPIRPEVDIAVLPLNQQISHVNDENQLTGSLALSSDTFAKPSIMIREGSGARTFGYPDGYVDKDSQFPIARDGMIASPYGNWFNEKPQYLVDGVMGEGMSGSPVFTERTTHFEDVDGSAHIAGASSFFIGVHSGEYRQTSASRNSDLNINQVWYSELIEQILMINGLSEYVDSVSFDNSSQLCDNNINTKDIENVFSKLTTWNLFDPERNRADSPVEFLDEQIDVKEISSIIGDLEDL